MWLVLKVAIVIVCSFFIYDVIVNSEELKINDFWLILVKNEVISLKNIAFLLIFTLINWFLEIKKWQVLTQKIEFISFKNATKQSLSSLTFSLITPNRIGDYGAKALYYRKPKRKSILVLNFIGNFYQLFFTLFLGWLGLFYAGIELDGLVSKGVMYMFYLIVITIVSLLILFKINTRFKIWLGAIITRFKLINIKSNAKVMLLSLFRYLVFSHQFYVLLLIFNIDISYWDALAGISSMYLIASMIPMLSLFDFILKGSVAIFVFSFFEVDTISIISITTIMWMLNFALPAIIGSYFVLTFKPIQE
ncbi:MAG: hypothetical protein JXQ93_04050 [Flavobacteriaceae bacterium]